MVSGFITTVSYFVNIYYLLFMFDMNTEYYSYILLFLFKTQLSALEKQLLVHESKSLLFQLCGYWFCSIVFYRHVWRYDDICTPTLF